MEQITSVQNSRIKNIHKLSAKARERKEQGLFIIEGARELSLALAGKYAFDSVYICPGLFEKTDYPEVLRSISPDILYEVNEAVFQKIAYREGSDGILALAKPQPHTLPELNLPENPFVIVLEAVEKPGNLGAILRTADAAKADAVIVCDPLTDIYNPNVIRSSVGCLFTVPVAICTNDEALTYLRNKQIQTYAAELTAAQWYQDTDFTAPSAIIMGTEADGLTDFWLQHAGRRIKIPMRGVIDSLNVSVSTAILTFEAMRQRGF
ncbi:MAG: RNA methyltransferase [Candidatus Symbiothrix sp.]|jgi:TrmH family RNA methyltransferase|nr:RNA methyltransferase [Candidatus Symbiothrix sp.]